MGDDDSGEDAGNEAGEPVIKADLREEKQAERDFPAKDEHSYKNPDQRMTRQRSQYN